MNNNFNDIKNIDYNIWKKNLSLNKRLFIIFFTYITFLFSLSLCCIFFITWTVFKIRLLTAIITLYLLPPFVARVILFLFPIKLGIIKINSNDFLKWWALLNLQMIFCRLPFLEEFLRIIPGIYGLWLRFWGSHIGRFTYWAPGLKILDRSFLRIGEDVVFGASVNLNPHVIYLNENDEPVLALDYVTLGDKTIIGGYSVITAGCIIFPNQSTRAALILPPFSKLKNGKRIKDGLNDL